MALAGTRFFRRSSSRSKPCRRAARSINRSVTNMISGRPALRYGVVGDVFVTTARPDRYGGNAVDGARQRPALVEWVERDGVRADGACGGGAEREEVGLG